MTQDPEAPIPKARPRWHIAVFLAPALLVYTVSCSCR